jgi:hypothetical protein
MVFIDRKIGPRGRATLPQHYRALIGGSHLLAAADSAELAGAVLSCDATSYHDAHCVGDGFLKIGEAALAIDPLSSSGVQAAIQSALAAGVAVHTMLSRTGSIPVAQCFYADHVRYTSNRHAAWAAQIYREHRRYSGSEFWRRRADAGKAFDQPGGSDGNRRDWRKEDRFAVSAGVKTLDVPCVVGDFVELRPAVSHRNLSRPVAFIGGLDLPAFLRTMPPVSGISDLEQSLSRALPEQNISKVMAWLFEHDLLGTI